MLLALIIAAGIWMGGYWMGDQLTQTSSGFPMKSRRSLPPIFQFHSGKYETKNNQVIMPAIRIQSAAYLLLLAAICINLLMPSTQGERIISTLALFCFAASILYEFYIEILYYSRVHRNSPEKLITILEDIGFPAERRLRIRATIISMDGEILCEHGGKKRVCTVSRKRDGMIIAPVLLESDGLKAGDRVKIAYFSSNLTDYPYVVIDRW